MKDYDPNCSCEPCRETARVIARNRSDAEERQRQFEAGPLAEWQHLRDTGGPVVAAVLELHEPQNGGYMTAVACAICVEPNWSGGTDPVDWPCDTFKAVRAAVSMHSV